MLVMGSTYGVYSSDAALIRLNPNGSLDTSFSGDGKLFTHIGGQYDSNNYGRCLTLQTDGKILVGGYAFTGSSSNGVAEFALARYLSNGLLDTTFSSDGVLMTSYGTEAIAMDVAVQSDGKILLAGYGRASGTSDRDMLVARYNANGTLDSGFGIRSVISTTGSDYGYAITVQADGKILIAGEIGGAGGVPDVGIARLNSNGATDTTFGTNGKVTTTFGTYTDTAKALLVQPDGKILMAGLSVPSSSSTSSANIVLARYNGNNGSLDTSFNGTGKVSTDLNGTEGAESIALQQDGKILVAGYRNSEYLLLRYNANGSLDTGFKGVGYTSTDVGPAMDGAKSVAIQSDRKIVVCGFSQYSEGSGYKLGVLRYQGDPVPEIVVGNPLNSDMTDNSTYGFGSRTVGTSSVTTFTIRNTGTAALTGLSIVKDGVHAGDFTVNTTGLGTSLAAGSSATFTVTSIPGATGLRSAAIHIASNDPDENPFDINLTVTGTSGPEISIEQDGGYPLADGDTTNFGVVHVNGGFGVRFTIRNIGAASLTGLSVSLHGANSSDFEISETPAASVGPGGNTDFLIGFLAQTIGSKTVVIRVASNDADENPYDINIQAKVNGRGEIEVENPDGSPLQFGADVFLGSVQVGQSIQRTIIVRNSGLYTLTGPSLTGIQSVFGSNEHFSAIPSLIPSIPPGGTSAVTLRFTPTSTGSISAYYHLQSNDVDQQGDFVLRLTGTGQTPASSAFDSMATASGLTGTNALPDATPFNDGVKNLLKYAFNMNLGGPDSRRLVSASGTAGLPVIVLEGIGPATEIRVEFLRRKNSGLIYTPKRSSTLLPESFVPMGGTPIITPINETWERVVFQNSADPAIYPRSFAIVEVVLPSL